MKEPVEIYYSDGNVYLVDKGAKYIRHDVVELIAEKALLFAKKEIENPKEIEYHEY